MVADSEKQGHPRLFFDRAWVEQFRARLAEDEPLNARWSRFLNEADKLLEETMVGEDYADAVDSQHGNYGRPSQQISRMGAVLGIAYQVTGARKYADKLREALLWYAGYGKWYGKGLLRNDPPWHSELNTSRFCYGFAVGYDCIFDVLTGEERVRIREAVVRLGIEPTLRDWVLPETRIHALDSMGHNWWSVMISQAGIAVLSVLGEEPRAEEWLREIAGCLPHYFTYRGSVLGHKSPNYDEKGAFYESVNYANYGLYEYLAFRAAYGHMFRTEDRADVPMLDKVGDFFLKTCYPASDGMLTVNFGDGHILGNAALSAKLLLACGVDDPRLRWYLRQVHNADDIYDFIYYDRIHHGAAHPPEEAARSEIYADIGWAVLRSSWEKDATLLAVKSGMTWNHAHADAGSFLLFHRGKPVLIDSGNCSYGRLEYHGYYLQSRAHNVVLFNGNGQNREDLFRGSKEPGQVYHLIDHSRIKYVYADATGPMSRYFSRNYRHFLWLDGVILIVDDLYAHEEGSMQWLLHYEGEASKEEGGGYAVANGAARVIVRTIFPREVRVSEEEGLADHDPDRKVPYFSFTPPAAAREQKFITAVIPMPAGDVGGSPDIAPLQGAEWIGVRIRHEGKQTDVILNLRADGRVMHRNSIIRANGYETDAYLFAVTTPDREGTQIKQGTEAAEPDFCFLAYGSFLRRDGNVLYTSLSKATAAFTLNGEVLEAFLHGQPQFTAEIYAAAPPSRITLNGKEAEGSYLADKKRVKLDHASPAKTRRPG
jgi:hypothetical protein